MGYMVGSIPTVEFVAHLDRHDIPMTQELQRLLRQQQCDNRATFRDYVKAIFPHRTDVGEEGQPGMLAYLAGVQQDQTGRPVQGQELQRAGTYTQHESAEQTWSSGHVHYQNPGQDMPEGYVQLHAPGRDAQFQYDEADYDIKPQAEPPPRRSTTRPTRRSTYPSEGTLPESARSSSVSR